MPLQNTKNRICNYRTGNVLCSIVIFRFDCPTFSLAIGLDARNKCLFDYDIPTPQVLEKSLREFFDRGNLDYLASLVNVSFECTKNSVFRSDNVSYAGSDGGIIMFAPTSIPFYRELIKRYTYFYNNLFNSKNYVNLF